MKRVFAAIGCKGQQEAGPSHHDPLGLETIPDDEPAAIAQTAANLEALITKTDLGAPSP